MQRHIEGLPQVILQPRKLSEFYWRRQSREDRISTVEAAALLLEDLGEPVDGAPGALGRALQTLNDALNRQSHYDTFGKGKEGEEREMPELSQQKMASNKQRLPKGGMRGAAAAAAAAAQDGRMPKLKPGERCVQTDEATTPSSLISFFTWRCVDHHQIVERVGPELRWCSACSTAIIRAFAQRL